VMKTKERTKATAPRVLHKLFYLADLVLQLLKSQLSVPLSIVPLPQDCRLGSLACFHMPVNCVVGNVRLPTFEPLEGKHKRSKSTYRLGSAGPRVMHPKEVNKSRRAHI
jgi:hypothetical protein